MRNAYTQPTAREMVIWLHDECGFADGVIALLVGCSRSTIWHIRVGDQSGRNIAWRLENIVLTVQENWGLIESEDGTE